MIKDQQDNQVDVSAAGTQAEKYVWHPKPLNIYVSMQPRTPLEGRILAGLRSRLEGMGCLFMEDARKATPLGPVPHLAIGFGTDLESELSPREIYGKLPKPRANVFVITVVDRIPDVNLFDLAREQLLRKASQMGTLFERDGKHEDFSRALWASMAGNNRLLEGNGAEILDSIALRIVIHAGGDRVSVPAGTLTDPGFTWEDWCASPVHNDISDAARRLGAAGIIHDEVPLREYGSHEQVRTVLQFLERSALGEGMRSQLDPHLRVMGVTTTGGGKVNLDPDPMRGQVVPISQLTWSGYVQAEPADCPIKYAAPSIETHENGLICLAGALMDAGRIRTYDEFLRYLKDHFAAHRTVDILPAGLHPRLTAIDHFHLQPKAGTIKDPSRVEIVHPDAERFPEIDFPCGVREAGLQLLSAVFRSETFCDRKPFDKLVIVLLPGHGSVALYNGPRKELTDLLTLGMEMEDVKRV